MEKINHVNYRVSRNGQVSVVNVQRMRALEKHDESLDQYEYDLNLAHEEVTSINNTIESLIIRKAELEKEQQKLEASKQIELSEVIHVNTMGFCMSIASDYSHYID